ncbi:MAG: hypothetical protein WBD46_02220 [Acidobacteriaceae bacterium]
MVSGSNMAGKSTWLRAIGVNAVLAYAGAPVRAAELRLSLLTVCASSSITDSLLDGKSRFFAEAERLRAILEQSSLDRPASSWSMKSSAAPTPATVASPSRPSSAPWSPAGP